MDLSLYVFLLNKAVGGRSRVVQPSCALVACFETLDQKEPYLTSEAIHSILTDETTNKPRQVLRTFIIRSFNAWRANAAPSTTTTFTFEKVRCFAKRKLPRVPIGIFIVPSDPTCQLQLLLYYQRTKTFQVGCTGLM
jgi:hypothetical protein